MALRKWNIAQGDKELSRRIAEEYNIPRFAAHLLVTRGCTDGESIRKMLSPGETGFLDPFTIADMDKAAARIEKAVASFERIMVYGDYDVDGITATSLLYSYLEKRQANVCYMLPSRDEDGYGLHISAVDKMAQMGVQLIVTVDNGISACEEIAYAASLGIETVVTDHHQPPDVLPRACAIVNPHRAGCPSSFKDYAGVGVAFKLVCAMSGDAEAAAEEYSDLVALGTVADVVPLLGENRMLVTRGLELLRQRKRPGLAELMSSVSHPESLTATDIAFSISPRINSAGRLGKPDRAVQLMLSDDLPLCTALANELQNENLRRHECERTIGGEAWKMLNENPALLNDRITVVCGEGWNHGVIGIFAAKLCESLGKPCIVLSSDGEQTKGSGRSLGSFSLHDAVASCRDLLTTYGGHTLAVGLTLPTENVEEFRRRINEYAAQREMPVPQIDIDCVLPLSAINGTLVDDADIMQPFGAENPAPVIGIKNAVLRGVCHVGSGQHQRLTLESGGKTITAMLFNVPNERLAYAAGDVVDCALAVSRSSYRADLNGVSAVIRDIRLSSVDVDSVIAADRSFEELLRGGELSPEQARRFIPERADLEGFYRFFKQSGFRGTLDLLAQRLAPRSITYEKMRTALCAMTECGLLRCTVFAGSYSIDTVSVSGKADLDGSFIMRRLRQLCD